jgi:radical SAM enzyme (TIGR01210 family)
MTKLVDFPITNQWVKSKRGPKNPVKPHRPYAFHVEDERNASGAVEKVATIFLSNRECPFQCLMCDLWKNTTDTKVTPGDIIQQISYALARLPAANSIKLYNSGNFFDGNAIPVSEYPSIAQMLEGYNRVIVENHPKLINEHTFRFNELLKPTLEVAMGLETSNPEVLQKLNKRMTLEDYVNAVSLLNQHDIKSRSFILLKTPFMDETEGIFWAKRSIDFALNTGVETAVIIPTRYGNEALNELGRLGFFSPPDIRSLEEVVSYGIALKSGNIFADLWDIERFSSCSKCLVSRKNRLGKMNITQTIYPEISCSCQ